MNEQTKIYPWLPWAVAILIGMILFWGLKYIDMQWPIGIWEVAQGVDAIRAINEFGSGILDMGAYREQRLIAFSGLILFFVLGPSLWIYGEIKNEKREISKPGDRLKKGPFWYVGVILIVIGLNYAIPATVMKAYYFNTTWQSAEESRNIDKVRAQLFTLASDATEYYYLSFNDGDEGGFINDQATFSLQQLDSYSSDTQNEYVLGPVQSDSVITIYGIGYSPGAKPDFKNANGDTGKVQLAVEVRPESNLIEFSNKNTNTR
ncbi:hypothetical protein G3570_12445 [Balneolaceae bacterium YR4-1]|uniref:Uncharacterized protein n=1 Tax=Halalkalibaculum roseum TaxID=2709311 RepID=A0A6M1SQS7_9BACT|nr:hypothetical protein [Halalkalibaculum roseum]NGP77449.1 hypothetical protein [Halalkalibaculum roseum]